jgi:hypothetical protein
VWRPIEIVELALNELRARAEALDAEDAVRGIDALDELEMHELLVQGLAAGAWGVLRERGYPASSGRKLSDRQRCDFVLTPERDQEPEAQLSKAMKKVAAQPGLFEAPLPRRRLVDPRECFWLEVKVVGQFEYVQGVPGPNGSWASSLVRSLAEDVRKLSEEPGIAHGGLLLILFTSEPHVATHDVAQALHRCLDRGLRVSGIERGAFTIRDRIGNACCSLTLASVWRNEEVDAEAE